MSASTTDHVVLLDDRDVTVDDVIAVARHGARIEITERSLAGMAATRAHIDELAASPEPVYGISTGFGALATRHISPELRTQLQRSLIRSHAAGMGEPVEREVVRALMFLRLKTLASGRTGIRPVVAQTMADLLNAGFDAVYDDATYDKLKEIYEGGAWANDLDRLNVRPQVFDHSLRYAENHDEARLAGKGQWGNVGRDVGRPVSALLFALSPGAVMLYSGQEVGEPADGAEGFGGDDARTSIFDYWSMPEFAKWVNDKKFDGGRLSPAQADLREFYSHLLHLIGEPAFQNGGFFPLNPANIENPAYGRVPGEQASGHWLYSFLRRDPATGQKFLVVINLHPTRTFEDVKISSPSGATGFLGIKADAEVKLVEKLTGSPEMNSRLPDLAVGSIPPLTPRFFEIIE